MLWLCIHLPDLPLAVFSRGHDNGEPLAISHGEGREAQILIANTVAMRHGVRAGMRVSAAHALAQGLRVHSQAVNMECAALERLAAWAGQFTSLVSIAFPQALLLEVNGSLAFFGGLEALIVQLRKGLDQLGYGAQLAVAPTPLAATWLARTGSETQITTNAELPGALSRLSLADVDITEAQLLSLRRMGVRTVGDCLRLPRDGLARRLGESLVLTLDRSLGKVSDPRESYVAPATFEGSFALPGSVDNTESLLFPLNRLIQELCGVLTARLSGVTALTLKLLHPKIPATNVELGLVAATRDARHLSELFRERLGRLILLEPVEEMILSAPQMGPLTESHRDFFAPKQGTTKTGAELIERLRSRLGRNAVQGIKPVAEHRPELAWCYVEPGESGSMVESGARPLWLLPNPITLEMRHDRPWFDELLVFEESRERIESGWWDGSNISRDYFIARNGKGERFWIFRDLSTQQWWLHGFFG